MGIDAGLAEEIVRRILGVTQPDRIILFGSAATEGMNRDSDIDLLVIEPSAPDPRSESIRIRRVLRGLGFPFDVIVMAAAKFDATKNVVGGIAYPASKYGRAIYERA